MRYAPGMTNPVSFARGVAHPEAFHGSGKTAKFFEGWYNKLVSADTAQRWAVIPGIFRGLDGHTHEAFVQVLDGATGRSWYHRFDIDDFEASQSEYRVRVGDNHFSHEGVTLALPQLQGTLSYTTPLVPWPVTWREPGIMGWYGLVPFMECFHGIVSFGHELTGSLHVEGSATDFSSGRGYIEKDWGQAFPESYVWLHSNHIEDHPDASLIGSVAIIPWIGRPFRGFIAGLHHSGRLHRWTTYNKTTELKLHIDSSHVRWELDGPDGILRLEAERVGGGALHAPVREAMHQRVEETLNATIAITHISPQGTTVMDSLGRVGAMEVYGDTTRLLAL